MKIYSSITGELLHIVFRLKDFTQGRENIISPDNFIQCSALKLGKGTTFRPHKHIVKSRTLNIIAQESWVVISGKVRCIYYDLDNKIITTEILNSGDASFTLKGGHNYQLLEDSIIYEYKTGPYEGQEKDKIFID